MAKTKLICPECKNEFERENSEINRAKREGAGLFCTQSCATKDRNKRVGRPQGKWDHLVPGRKLDDLSPFRFFIKCMKNDGRKHRYNTEVTPEYLKEVWNNQNGICPYTGWKLELPHGSMGWKSDLHPRRASVDRIDCSKGYIKDNVQFVSIIANYAKNSMTDTDLIEFCKAVYDKRRSESLV
jgi:hypothetical protein